MSDDKKTCPTCNGATVVPGFDVYLLTTSMQTCGQCGGSGKVSK
jgi:DnaJ-class molecular chaperone